MVGLALGAGVAIGLLVAQAIAVLLEFAAVRIGYETIAYSSLLAGLLVGWWLAFTKWERKETQMPPTCIRCGGRLIGSEISYGTCGHCGGRAKR